MASCCSCCCCCAVVVVLRASGEQIARFVVGGAALASGCSCLVLAGQGSTAVHVVYHEEHRVTASSAECKCPHFSSSKTLSERRTDHFSTLLLQKNDSHMTDTGRQCGRVRARQGISETVKEPCRTTANATTAICMDAAAAAAVVASA